MKTLLEKHPKVTWLAFGVFVLALLTDIAVEGYRFGVWLRA